MSDMYEKVELYKVLNAKYKSNIFKKEFKLEL